MAFSKIFISPIENYEADGQEARSVIFDAVTTFNISYNNDITSYPVSDKSVISNHKVKRNTTFTVEGWISTQALIGYENNIIPYVDPKSRPQILYNVIKRWDDEGIDLALIHEFDVFSPCQIKSWEPVMEGSDSILVKIVFERIRRVSYKRVFLVQNMSPSKKLDADANKGKTDDSKSLTERESQVGRSIDDGLNIWWNNVKTDTLLEVNRGDSVASTGGSN